MITITNEDAITLLANLADASVDMVCIDPPYTDGKKKHVLQKHKIQTVLDIEKLTKEHFRVLKNDTFYCVFGLMPTIFEWYNQALNAGFTYKEHIIWAKRMISSPYLDIQRTHESIFIFAKGKPKFKKTNARMEDLKTPALHLGLYELSTMKTLISDLHRRLLDRKYDDLYYAKTPKQASGGKSNDSVYDGLLKVKGNDKQHQKSITKQNHAKDDLDYYIEENGLEPVEREFGETAERGTSDKRNDKLTAKTYQKENTNDKMYSEQEYGRAAQENGKGFRYRSKLYNNITNLWSFLPHNQQKFNNEDNNIKHPTVKPIELIERLILLCTSENAIVLDDFLGSGTTALACQNTKRDFVGCEIDKDYYGICLKRIEKNINLFT